MVEQLQGLFVEVSGYGDHTHVLEVTLWVDQRSLEKSPGGYPGKAALMWSWHEADLVVEEAVEDIQCPSRGHDDHDARMTCTIHQNSRVWVPAF